MAQDNQTDPGPEPSGTFQHLGLNFHGIRQEPPSPHPGPLGEQGHQPPPPGPPMSPRSGAQPNNGIPTAPGSSDTVNLQQENNELRAQLARLEAQRAPQPLPRPFISDEDFATMRSQSVAFKELEERKATVPDMVPGFRANPLTHGESRTVPQLVQHGRFHSHWSGPMLLQPTAL
ncbi:hypothetical protein M422DRAFT_53645 [Sphaerobolus stellatus SS14]|uniref:Uncharacterized protein n=1 Tax=Sphaerobolus stellatus (strain SS14) TaxID=990650 RepID=A0A0C9UZB6_SPHS4|nr:hypothetical protein M422DRAFT_53645 [Sphaerobolus stellatus SS14]